MGRTQFGAIQQVLQHALRLLKLAAFLEQQSVAQARLGARISRCNACVFALSFVQRVPRLESPGIQKLRVGGFEIRILLGEQFQRRARRRKILFAKLRLRLAQQQRRIVLKNALQAAAVHLDGFVKLGPLEQLFPEPPAGINIAGNLHFRGGAAQVAVRVDHAADTRFCPARSAAAQQVR